MDRQRLARIDGQIDTEFPGPDKGVALVLNTPVDAPISRILKGNFHYLASAVSATSDARGYWHSSAEDVSLKSKP